MFYIGVFIVKEFVRWLLSEENSKITIELFDRWHFMYWFIIFGGTILLSILYCNKSDKAKDKIIRLFAYLTIGIYISDFFLMPLSDSYGFSIGIDDLPFHICTIMATMVPFVQFSDKFKRLKTVIVTLSVTSSLMWMAYPGSALGEPPFSYVILSKFLFHGVLFCWGVLNLSLGAVHLQFKKIWHEFCAILIILAWSSLGNAIYDNQNWFFIKDSIFDFLPDKIMPPVVVFCVFGSCFLVYCGYYAIQALASKRHRQPLKLKNA